MPANVFLSERNRSVLDSNDLRYQDYNNISTPEWIISADEIFSQDIENSDYKKFSRCYTVGMAIKHGIRNNVNGNFTASGQVVADDTSVTMPIGPYITDLTNKLNSATTINTIVIIRLSRINGVLVPLQTVTYTTCYVTQLQQTNDNLEFHFRYIKYVIEYAKLDQKGAMSGSTVSEIDFNKNNFS